jgi:hypothetical protein
VPPLVFATFPEPADEFYRLAFFTIDKNDLAMLILKILKRSISETSLLFRAKIG